MKKTYKKLRTEMKMTQRELSKKLGMNNSYYCLVENYKRPLKLDKAILFVKIYNAQTGNDINFLTDVKHLI